MNSRPDERVSERSHHQTELLQARLSGLRLLQKRLRLVGGGAGLLAAVLVLALLAAPGNAQDPDRGSRSKPLDRLFVRGAVHVLDEDGREIALLGQERRDGPIVMGLYPPAGSSAGLEQTLRLATSASGSAISIRDPKGDATVTVFANAEGAELELRRGSDRRVISEGHDSVGTQVAKAPRSGPLLPAVGSAAIERAELDLAASELQPIGHGFLVAGLETSTRADGVRVKGRMINTSSVRHRDLTFRIRLGGGSATFGIPVISSSNSTGFSITIPGANPGTSTSAEIAYLGSTITYFDHNTRGVTGRVVANSR